MALRLGDRAVARDADPYGHQAIELEHGDWWACEEPERPPTPGMVYDTVCRACRLKAEVELARSGDRLLFWFHPSHGRTRFQRYTLAELVAGERPDYGDDEWSEAR